MDYHGFKFDLQLFAAAVALDVTDVAAELATTTKYCTVKEGEFTWHTSLTDVSTAVTGGATFIATLTGKKLEVAAGDTDDTTVTISGATATQMKDVTIGLTKTLAVTGDPGEETVTSTAGSKAAEVAFADSTLSHLTFGLTTAKTVTAAFDATTACKVTGTQGASITVPHPADAEETLELTATTGTLTVLSTGTGNVVVSGFTNGSVGTLVDNSTEPAETNTLTATVADGKADFAVSGSVLGRWVNLDSASAAFTIKTTGEKVFSHDVEGVATQVNAVDFSQDDVKLSLATADAGKFYTLQWNSTTKKYSISAADDSLATATDPVSNVGFFKFTIDENVNKPIATLKFYPGTNTSSAATAELIGNLTIDATGLDNITISGSKYGLHGLVVTGLNLNPDEDLTITGLAPTATVTGMTETDTNITYAPTYTLDSSAFVLGAQEAGEGAAVYYSVTKGENTGTAKRPAYKYTITKLEGHTAPTDKAYFKVQAAVAGEPAVKTYTVSFDNTNDDTITLAESCWSDIAVNAEALSYTDVVKFAGVAAVNDAYTVTAHSGIAVTAESNAALNAVTRTGKTIAKFTDDSLAGGIPLKITDSKPYYPVTFTESPANSGAYTVKIGAAQGAEPSAPYFVVTNADGAASIRYVNTDATKRLSDLVGTDGTTPFKITITGAGADITSLDITDTPTGGPTNVDYKVTNLPAGTTITGNTALDDISDAWAEGYVLSGTLDLSKTTLPTEDGSATTYYLVSKTADTDSKGVSNITVATSGVTGTATVPSDTEKSNNNYFVVTATKSGDNYSYSVHYLAATTPANVFDLTGASIPVTGGVTVDTTGVEKDALAGISLVTDGNTKNTANIATALYFVKVDEENLPTEQANIKTTLNDAGTPVTAGKFTYLDHYELGATTTIALTGVAAGTPQYYVATVDTAANSGVHKYNIASGVTTKPTDGSSYFTATLADGVMTLTFTEGTKAATATQKVMTKSDIATLLTADSTAQFTVDAEGIAATATSIVLTNDTTDGKINYDVTNVPKTVTGGVTNKGNGDTVAYQQTYVLDDDANTITLGATAGIFCYKVTKTGGTEALLGVNTVKIEASGVTIAKDATPAEIAEAMEKAKIENYFVVTTDADKNVAISYTKAPSNGIPLDGSGITVAVDASDAEQVSDVTFTLSSTGDTVYKYSVDGLTKNQTVSPGANTTATPALDYEQSYKINFASGSSIVLDNTQKATAPVDYYVVEIDTTYDGSRDSGTAKGILQYNILNKATAATIDADIAALHYIKVTYNSDYVASITYVNANGDKKYDLSADAIGRITIDATNVGAKVDTINIDADDTANYEVLHVKGGVTVERGTKDVVSYDTVAKLTGSITLDDDDPSEVFYAVTAGTTTDGVTACTLGSKLTTKPTDATVNYITVTRAAGGYTVDYTPATSGTALTLGTTSALTVAGSDADGNTIAPAAAAGGKTVTNKAGVTMTVTGAPGGWTIANVANDVSGVTGTATIAYATKFAWTAGVYYIAVDGADKAADVVPGATAAASKADSAKSYVVVKVERNTTTGVYKITTTGKTASPNATTGIMTENDGNGGTTDTAFTGTLTVQAPDSTANWKFDATNAGDVINAITNVQNGAVLTNLANTATVTTATLAAPVKNTSTGVITYNTISVTPAGGSEATFAAGTAGVIDLYTDGTTMKVISGALALTEVMASALVSSEVATSSVQVMTLGEDSDGVIVTFDKTKGVASVTGLEKGEIVQVTEGTTTYQYAYSDDGKYIEKVNINDLEDTTKAAASTGDILSLGYSDGTAVQYGKFIWSTGDDYYIAADGSGKYALAVSATTKGTVSTTATTYIHATITGGNTLALESVKSNSLGLVDKSSDFTGTVTIENPEIAFNYTKTADTKFGVAVTGAKNGSTFSGLGSNDSVTGLAGADITMDSIVYDAVDGKTLEFVGGALKNGTVTLSTQNAVLTLSSGKTVSATSATPAMVLVVTDGEITSMKSLGAAGVVEVEEYNGEIKPANLVTTTTYTASDSGKTVTKAVKDAATGEIANTVYSLEAEGDEVIGATEKGVSVTSNFAWGTAKTVAYLKITGGTPEALGASGKSSTNELSAEDEGYVRVEITAKDATTNVQTLEITPMVVAKNASGKATGLVEDTMGNFSGTVTITASATAANSYIQYDGTAKSTSYKVAFVDVGNGSAFTLAKGDTVATADFDDSSNKVTVNNTAFTADGVDGAANKLKIYCDGKNARITSGRIAVTDTTYITADAGTASANATMTLAADGTVLKTPNGVKATFADGAVSAITNLDKGESVTITKADGSSVKYESPAITANTGVTIWKTTTTAEGVATVLVKTMASAAGDVVTGGDGSGTPGTNDYKTTVTASKAFAWTGDALGGYVLVDPTAATATLVNGATTIGYQDFGKTYIKAAIDSNDILTLTSGTVDAQGNVGDGATISSGGIKLTMTLPTAGRKIDYTKTAGIASLTVTGAAAGSAFKGFADDDDLANLSVTTASMKAGEGFEVATASKTYAFTAGAAGALSFQEGKAYSGIFKLATATTKSENTLSAYVLDSTTKEATTSTVTYTAGGTGKEQDGALVTLSNGKIASIKGLGDDETIVTNVVVVEKDGTSTTTNTTYTAEKIGTTGADYGKLKVTKTVVVNGVTTVYNQTFANNTAELTVTTGWTAAEETTAGTFDWTNSGYWLAKLDETGTAATNPNYGKYVIDTTSGETSPIATSKVYSITNANKTKVYIALDSEKKLDGSYNVKSVKLVQVQENGALKDFDGAIGAVAITALGTAGLTLPTDHDGVFTITTGATNGKTYTIGEQDTLTATLSTASDTVTVNGTICKTVEASTDVTVNGDGSIKETTAAKKGLVLTDADFTDAKGAVIHYTKGTVENGAEIAFATTGVSKIGGLTGGESVKVTAADGAVTTYTADTTDATNKTIIRSITKDGVTETAKITLTTAGDDVLSAAFAPAEAFAWSGVGYFKISDPVKTRTGTGYITTPTSGEKYVRVVASGDATKGYTISALDIYAADANGILKPENAYANPDTRTVTITAPGSLTLADGAITLTPKDPTDLTKGYYDRTFGIDVKGAQDGQTFSGLSSLDTVTGSGLAAGAELKVNKVAYEAAANGVLTISGDGYAQDGSFVVDKTHTVQLASVDVKGTPTPGTTTIKFSKGDGAKAEISSSAISAIKQIGAGETIVVTEALKDGATTVTTFTSTSITSGDDKGKILVTKTVEADGATTKYTMVIATDGEDVWTSEGWTKDGDVTTTSKFDWTAAGNSGYFAVTPTLTDGVLKGIGTVAVEPQSKEIKITKADKDKYYLKVTPAADNTVSVVGLYQVQADGAMKSVAVTGLEGTINITAPTGKALTYNNVVTEAKLAVNIAGAAAKSAVMMKSGDTLTTAALAAPTTKEGVTTYEKVTVNGQDYQAGAAGTMKFLAKGSTAADALVSSGAIVMSDGFTFYATGVDDKVGTTFDTDNVTVAYAKGTGTDDTPVVTVKNGVVATITGLKDTNGAVTTTINGAALVYAVDAQGVMNLTSTTAAANVTTAALAKGATATFGGVAYTSAADNNQITFVNEGGAMTVKDGALTFSGTAFKTTGTSDAVDYVQVSGTATAATVTVKDGAVKSITGLASGQNIVLTKHNKTTDAEGNTVYVDTVETYTLAGSKLTKSVKVGTADATTYTAYITDNADILAASYTGGSATVDTDEGAVVGQFAWNDTSNENSKRATGYFEITNHKAKPVTDQASEVKLAAKAADTNYLVASVASLAAGAADGVAAARQLTLGALTVYGTKSAKKGQTADYALTASDVVTITAPTTATPISYTKDGAFQLIVNKLTANSVIANITKGDKVTTAALADGDLVRVGGNAYTAGAKNATLTFVGETDGAETPTLTAALLSGKIKIAAGSAAVLSGDTEKNDAGASANDVTVAVAGSATNVVVNVANGLPTSITNLTGIGATVTITKTGAATVQYEVLDANSTMIQRTEFTDTNGNGTYDAGTDTLVGTITRKTLTKAGLELDTAKAYMAGGTTTFKDTVTLSGQDKNFAALDWAVGGTKTAYVRNAYGGAAITSKTAADAGVTSNNVTDGTIVLNPAENVLKVTMSTNANTKVTTISKVEYLRADATGKLAAVKNLAFAGTVTIDGAASGTPTNDTDALINFTLPVYGTARQWNLTAQNVAIGSVFKNLVDGDAVTTAAKTGYELSKGTVTLYHANDAGGDGTFITETATVTYAGTDKANVDVTGVTLSNLKNFKTKGEKLTVVSNTETAGEVTTIYEVLKDDTLQKTETAADGTKKVYTYKMTAADLANADFDAIAGAAYAVPDPLKNTIVSNFDWTMDKNTTGYFAATNGKAAVKAAKTTITSKNTGVYIAVTVDADGNIAANGITAVKYDTDSTSPTAGTMIGAGADAFSGTITIAAPTKTHPLTLDRTTDLNVATITAESTKLAVTGALSGSVIDNLAEGDTVTTAALKAANWDAVTLDGIAFTAGANGALTITMQQNAKGAMEHTLTAGTVVLDNRWGANTEGNGFLYVGSGTLVEAANGTSITVQASKNGAAYTIGDIGENEVFKVNGATYRKSDKTLLRETVNAETGNTEYAVYNIGAGKTITSAVLDNAKVWKSTTPAFTDDDPTGNSTHTFTVDLATLDARTKKEIAANKAKNWGSIADAAAYDFVIDRYLSSDVKAAAALAGATVTNAAAWQVALGTGAEDVATRTWTGTKTYTASNTLTVGQTIKGAKDWSVVGTGAADVITGASANTKGVVTNITGAGGNDTITGGGATENFVVGQGNDVLKSYATGKDAITTSAAGLNGNFEVYLAGTGLDVNGKTKLTGVLLYDGTNDASGLPDTENMANSVLLVGMGNGKAVEIDGKNYYFGNGALTKGAASFAFDTVKGGTAAYYYGNAKLTNTVKVTTDKTKATKTTIGDTVTVDLTATDDNGVSFYNNINAVDASASGNRVYLKAADTGSLLKGGSYQSTLQGGAGNDTLQGGAGADVFWFKDGLDGSDTLKSYTAAQNDAIYLGEWTSGGATTDGVAKANGDAMEANGFVIKADGANVILTNASGLGKVTIEGAAASTKAVRFSTDGTAANALSYYVASGKTKTNLFTAKDADVTKGAESALKAADGTTKLYDYSYKHYYVGTSAATDTLKITSTDKDGIKAAFSLESTNLSSIDVLDASSLNKKSAVALIGASDRNCTLKGSAANTERFVVQSGAGKTTYIEGFTLKTTASVGDVIELAGGDSIKTVAYKDGSYISFDLNNGGKVSIKGATLANFSSVKVGDTSIRGTK